MPGMDIKLLGTFEVIRDGESINGIETDKGRALLAYLAIGNGRVHRREVLAGLFWPESPATRARQNLSQALYNLRKSLRLDGNQEILQLSMQEVVFWLTGEVRVDGVEFNTLVAACKKHTHIRIEFCPICMDRLAQAVELYPGEFLIGLNLRECEQFEAWQLEQRQALQDQVRWAFTYLTKGLELKGSLEQALVTTRRWVGVDPYNEAAVRQLMVLLSRLNNRSQALWAYEDLRNLLEAEFGIEPEAETQALCEKIRAGNMENVGLPTHNLPSALTPFYGREKELGTLYLNLVNPEIRLLTILGPGGIGKTRLALETARAMLPAFADGVYLIELSDTSSTDSLLAGIASLVGLESGLMVTHSPEIKFRQGLYDQLRNKEILLLVDSFEVIQNGGSEVLVDILRHASGVRILVTSRVRLNIKGEHLFILNGLQIPDEASDLMGCGAVQLFVDAAQRQQPDFQLSEENLHLVGQICQAVEGMPLGILLAAVWAGCMPLDEIEQHIRSSLDFLASSWQDLPIRQRSLRATFEYSWNMLESRLQRVFCRLAIFRKGFQIDRAAKITGISLLDVKVFIECSLLQASKPNFFRMHDAVHAFALEKLQEDPEEMLALYDRFSREYLVALKDWSAELKTSLRWEVLDEMDMEIENARSAWNWAAVQNFKSELLPALSALCRYYEVKNRRTDGYQACQVVLEQISRVGLSNENIRLWARLKTWSVVFTERGFLSVGQELKGLDQLEKVAAELSDPRWTSVDTRWELAFALGEHGMILLEQDIERTQALLEKSLLLFNQVGDPWDRAEILFSQAVVQERLGDFYSERQLVEQALEILGPDGDPSLLSNLYYYLALTFLMTGAVDKAAPLIDTSIGFYRQSRAEDSFNIMVLMLWSGEFTHTLDLLQKLIASQEQRWQKAGSLLLGTRVLVLFQLGRYDEALRGLNKLEPGYFLSLVRFISGGVHLLNGEVLRAVKILEASAVVGRSLPDHRVLGMILALLCLAHARNMDFQQSKTLWVEALQTALGDKNIFGVGHTLAVTALLLAENGYLAKAVEVYASASRHKTVVNSVFLRELVGDPIHCLTASLPETERQAAWANGSSKEQAQVLAEILASLENSPSLGEGLKRLVHQ